MVLPSAYNANVKALTLEALRMGVSTQLPRWPGRKRLWLVLLAMLLGALLLAPAGAQAQEPQRWMLQDRDGHPWSLTLLEQADSAYPSGLRLRLTDRSGAHQLDHGRPLQLKDGVGGGWLLLNRSEELVPAGDLVLPAASAQFDLAGLQPRPRSELPLAIEVPLEAGGEVVLVAGAAAVAGLHGA